MAVLQQIWLENAIIWSLGVRYRCVKIGEMEHGLKDIAFYVKKNITPCTVVITSLLVRKKPVRAPASVKRVYWSVETHRTATVTPPRNFDTECPSAPTLTWIIGNALLRVRFSFSAHAIQLNHPLQCKQVVLSPRKSVKNLIFSLFSGENGSKRWIFRQTEICNNRRQRDCRTALDQRWSRREQIWPGRLCHRAAHAWAECSCLH